MTIQTIARRDTGEETKQVNFRLPKKLHEELKEIASTKSMSMALIVDSAIREKLNQLKNDAIFS